MTNGTSALVLPTLTIRDNLTRINFTDKNSFAKNKYIVIHYFGSLGTAYAVSEYFRTDYRGASAHLNLDETKIVWRSVLDDDIAWHCGANKYVHPYCRNSNSIGIEVRPYILDKSQSNSAAYRGWYFGQEVEDNLVELVKYLMAKYDIPIENVIRHYDVTGKWCPRPWMGTDLNLYYKTTGDAQWKRFKERLVEETMTDKEIYEAVQRHAGTMSLPKWAADATTEEKEAYERAIANGITDGSNPMILVPRYQAAIMANRAYEKAIETLKGE